MRATRRSAGHTDRATRRRLRVRPAPRAPRARAAPGIGRGSYVVRSARAPAGYRGHAVQRSAECRASSLRPHTPARPAHPARARAAAARARQRSGRASWARCTRARGGAPRRASRPHAPRRTPRHAARRSCAATQAARRAARRHSSRGVVGASCSDVCHVCLANLVPTCAGSSPASRAGPCTRLRGSRTRRRP